MTAPRHDPYDLQRFVAAQAGVFATALRELKAGAKRSHWMWFIFPQVAGLGRSTMAERYAIRSRAEAAAYRSHPVLGPRLHECTDALLAVSGRSAEEIMGPIDALKLHSSMTLFAALAPPPSPFHAVLDRYFSGAHDRATLDFLSADEGHPGRDT